MIWTEYRRNDALILFCVALGLSGFSFDVLAQAQENNVTSDVMNQYRTVMSGMATRLSTLAAGTFWALATIELVYSVGMKALGGGDPGDVLRSLVKRLLFIGFWGWMLMNAQNIVDWMIDTMVVFAAQATMPATFSPSVSVPVVGGNSGAVLNPDNIVDKGIQIVLDTIDILPSGLTNLPTALSMLIAAIFVFIAMLVIAAYMALALLEVYVVGYGGVFLLALGPNRHTNGYAQAYLRYLMSVGIKIFAIALIAAIAEVVMTQHIAQMVGSNAGQLWSTVAIAGILMVLAAKAPNAIMGAIQGISNSSAPVSAGGLIRGAAMTANNSAGVSLATGAVGAAAVSGGSTAGAIARASGSSGIVSAAKAVGGGLSTAASSAGRAALDEAKEGLMGRSGNNPFPRGGTAGGRMASRIAENARRRTGK